MSVALAPGLLKLTGAAIAALSSPVVAGPLLYILTRDPGDNTRIRLVEQLQKLPGNISVDTITKTLKFLLTFNVVRTVNSYLNTISQNNWTLRANTADWKWDKEVAVITGGAAGIGEQTVIRLLQKNMTVVVLDISPLGPALKDYANVHFIKTNVTDPNAINEAAAQIKEKIGPVSILINNAGIGNSKLITDNSPEYLQKIFGVNIFSHFYTVKAFLPDMVKRNHGHIVTIASTASFMSLPTIGDYASTKAGVLSFHEALKREIIHAHEAPNVLTTIVHPNWTRTALIAKEADKIEKQQGPLLTPEAVADAIAAQIFACRGAQVILPSTMTFLSTVKAWPNWMQEGLRGILGAQTVKEIAV